MEQKSKTNREMIAEVLGRLHPECDVGDDETLYGLILEDYEAYANVLERHESEIAKAEAAAEIRGRNAKIEEMLRAEPDDGVPVLRGANIAYRNNKGSIFEIAKQV